MAFFSKPTSNHLLTQKNKSLKPICLSTSMRANVLFTALATLLTTGTFLTGCTSDDSGEVRIIKKAEDNVEPDTQAVTLFSPSPIAGQSVDLYDLTNAKPLTEGVFAISQSPQVEDNPTNVELGLAVELEVEKDSIDKSALVLVTYTLPAGSSYYDPIKNQRVTLNSNKSLYALTQGSNLSVPATPFSTLALYRALARTGWFFDHENLPTQSQMSTLISAANAPDFIALYNAALLELRDVFGYNQFPSTISSITDLKPSGDDSVVVNARELSELSAWTDILSQFRVYDAAFAPNTPYYDIAHDLAYDFFDGDIDGRSLKGALHVTTKKMIDAPLNTMAKNNFVTDKPQKNTIIKKITITQSMLSGGYIAQLSQSDFPEGYKTTVSAKVTDSEGKTSPIASDAAAWGAEITSEPNTSTNTTSSTKAPVVRITEDINNDGILSAAELSGEIGISIQLPNGTKVGDSLTLTSSYESVIKLNGGIYDMQKETLAAFEKQYRTQMLSVIDDIGLRDANVIDDLLDIVDTTDASQNRPEQVNLNNTDSKTTYSDYRAGTLSQLVYQPFKGVGNKTLSFGLSDDGLNKNFIGAHADSLASGPYSGIASLVGRYNNAGTDCTLTILTDGVITLSQNGMSHTAILDRTLNDNIARSSKDSTSYKLNVFSKESDASLSRVIQLSVAESVVKSAASQIITSAEANDLTAPDMTCRF